MFTMRVYDVASIGLSLSLSLARSLTMLRSIKNTRMRATAVAITLLIHLRRSIIIFASPAMQGEVRRAAEEAERGLRCG